jgi:hypothetical protein
MRKQIGLRMKDETRDQLERVRGGLSRTDYIEGAVLAQIARDLKKVETPHEYSLDTGTPVDIIEDDRMPPNMAVTVPGEEVFVGGEKVGSLIPPTAGSVSWGPVRSSAESKSGVLPVPKRAQKGRK